MLHHSADTLLDRLAGVRPIDEGELRLLEREQGWVEAIRHLAERGMLTPEGRVEAADILTASAAWADTLTADEPVMPAVPADADGVMVTPNR